MAACRPQRAVAPLGCAAWDRSDCWAAADLSPVLDLAARVGADIQIRDRSGHVVASSPGFGGRVASQLAHRSWSAGSGAGEAAVRRVTIATGAQGTRAVLTVASRQGRGPG